MTEIIFTATTDLIDLDKLPGGRELYEQLTDVFLAAYLSPALPISAPPDDPEVPRG